MADVVVRKSEVRKRKKRWTNPKPEMSKRKKWQGGTRVKDRCHPTNRGSDNQPHDPYPMSVLNVHRLGDESAPDMRIGSPAAMGRVATGNDTGGRVPRIARDERRVRPLEWKVR